MFRILWNVNIDLCFIVTSYGLRNLDYQKLVLCVLLQSSEQSQRKVTKILCSKWIFKICPGMVFERRNKNGFKNTCNSFYWKRTNHNFPIKAFFRNSFRFDQNVNLRLSTYNSGIDTTATFRRKTVHMDV